MTERELRLRQRIDQLTDERDRLRDQLERCRQARRTYWVRADSLARSLQLWRTRAGYPHR